MTTVSYTQHYSISGFSYDYRDTDDHSDDYPVAYDPHVTFSVSGDAGAGFSYEVSDYPQEGDISATVSYDTYEMSIDGQSLFSLYMQPFVYTIDWTQDSVSYSTTLLELEWDKGDDAEGYAHGTRYFFVLGGDDLPDFSSLEEFMALDAAVTDVRIPSGAFGPGVTIEWGSFAEAELLGTDDDIWGTIGDDDLSGGFGDDYFYSSEGNDTYRGGEGLDQVTFGSDPAGVTVTLYNGTAIDGWGDTDRLFSIETLRGSMYADLLIGSTADETMRGLAGADTMNGGDGIDTVRYDRDANYGGTAGVTVNLAQGFAIDGFGDRDTLRNFENVRGSSYGDVLTGSAVANEIRGNEGNDRLTGLAGADTLEGGDGNDSLFGGDGYDLLWGEDGNDLLQGGNGRDTLWGGEGRDTLAGGTDNDVLYGEAGNDLLQDDGGNDLLQGGDGDDMVHGGDGDDTLSGGTGADTLVGWIGRDRLAGEGANDLLQGNDGNDTLLGGDGNDTLSGGTGADRLDGGTGADMLRGEGGNDVMIGYMGNDTLWGGLGNDTLNGGAGNDILRGDGGADTFVFSGAFGKDVIADFTTAGTLERIDLSGVGAITGFADLTANHLSMVAGNAVIDDGAGNTITLRGVAASALHVDDFLF